ncbi:MAG: hypothetical protein AMJ62_12815 [Myxococcales bacterium SG8_38]|nr:MAG: hypothetical protein AMJ62_12815 [Myxococcales bacterium SG8_38]
MVVKRLTTALLLLSVLSLHAPMRARAADRDIAVFDAVFGGTVSKFAGNREWQPSLWAVKAGPWRILALGAERCWRSAET